MSDYFKSSQVSVFPSTYRTQGTGKFTSEFNFTNIINSLIDKSAFESGDDGFVLDYDKANKVLKVIIHGYYFEIKDYTPSSTTKILEIKVANTAEYLTNHRTSEIDLDNTSLATPKFEGLAYGSSITADEENYKYYHIHVCDDSGNIKNKARLVSDSIMYSGEGSTQLLTTELDAKHYKLKVGNGLQGAGDTSGAPLTNIQNQENEIKLDVGEYAKLTSLLGETSGETITLIGENGKRLIYFTDKGIAKNSNASVGTQCTTKRIAGVDYTYEQSMYVENGTINNGFSILAGTGEPPKSGVNKGDIYFKYQV